MQEVGPQLAVAALSLRCHLHGAASSKLEPYSYSKRSVTWSIKGFDAFSVVSITLNSKPKA